MSATDERPPACPNCGEVFGDDRPRFCPACGQETRLRPPTIGEFVQQFGGAFISTEGALWRTLRLLLLRPGELTRQYLAGRRKHYVLPLRLYLTVSVIVLLALRLVASAGLEPDGAIKVSARPAGTMQIGMGRAGVKDGKFFCDDLPQWLCRRLQKRLDLEPARLLDQVRATGERFVANLGAAMFVLLPAFALYLKLVYWNRGLRYTEHLVFALHLHAAWFVAIALTLVDQQWLSAIASCAIPVYAMMAMKRVYGGRFWPRLARGAVVSLLYLMTLALSLTGLAVVTFLA